MPSLLWRIVLAIVLMLGFYVLALSIVGGLLFLPYAEWQYAHRIHPKLAIACLVGAGVVLWAILPRFDHFEPPGPRLLARDHPRLFEELVRTARQVAQEMPAEVYLLPAVNAFVTERGGVMGLGSRRVMGIGLPLLQTLSVRELRGVLAHEFGHFHGGDTKLGPWIYKTRGAIGRAVGALSEQKSALGYPFVWYGMLFVRITNAVSRRQELAADRLAVSVAGSKAFASGLRTVHGVAEAFDAYLEQEYLPVLNAGLRPPVGDGFGQFLRAGYVAGIIAKVTAKELERAVDPYDSHPPLAERLAAVEGLAGGEGSDGTAPAISLLDHVPEVEAQLLVTATGDRKIAKFPQVAWQEVGERFYVPLWQRGCAERRAALSGLTPVCLPGLVPKLGEIGRSFVEPSASDRDAERAAITTFGAAFALALRRGGWRLSCLPGEPVRLERDGEALEPFDILPKLAAKTLAPEAWLRRCASLQIETLDLAPGSV
ncbi:MAG: M48 family metallopeptidase [Planctomycetes bacterium]|nr:M48 family metallopeptidase [Planctomycetota bacterium]